MSRENVFRELCQRAVDAWGDYVPRPETKAAHVLRDMKEALDATEEVETDADAT